MSAQLSGPSVADELAWLEELDQPLSERETVLVRRSFSAGWAAKQKQREDRDAPAAACLRAFVLAYANTESISHDRTEIELFRIWLRAAALLGMTAAFPEVKRRP